MPMTGNRTAKDAVAPRTDYSDAERRTIDSVASISAHVVDDVKSFAVGPAEFDRVQAKFLIEEGALKDYAEALVDNLNATTLVRGEGLTTDQMVRYLNTLLYLRILMVNHDSQRHRWLDLVPYPTIPAFFAVFLESVGIARDLTLGIEIVPEFGGSAEDVMEPQEFRAFSNQLARFSKAGFEYAETFPRDIEGSWDLMSMQLIHGEIRNHDGKAHVIYALLASLYTQTITEGVLLPRVTYGRVDRFRGLIAELARLK